MYYDVHIFVDTWNASVEEVGATVLRVAAALQAFAIVLSGTDQVLLLLPVPFQLGFLSEHWRHEGWWCCPSRLSCRHSPVFSPKATRRFLILAIETLPERLYCA